MTIQEQQRETAELRSSIQPGNRRWLLLAISTAALLLMLFYGLTDGAHINHDPLLTTADWSGYALCHRITERSFTINGRQFPLCARCTGMYLGAALTIVVLFLAGRAKWQEKRKKKKENEKKNVSSVELIARRRLAFSSMWWWQCSRQLRS